MKKSLRYVVFLVLAVVMCIGTVGAAAGNARSSLYLDCYRAWLAPQSGGKIAVAVDVEAVTTMDEVGASKIEIFESDDDGQTWESVRIYFKSLYPEMVVEDDYLYYDDPIVYQGTVGKQYFACVTAYAADSTGYDEKEYNTGIVTAKAIVLSN